MNRKSKPRPSLGPFEEKEEKSDTLTNRRSQRAEAERRENTGVAPLPLPAQTGFTVEPETNFRSLSSASQKPWKKKKNTTKGKEAAEPVWPTSCDLSTQRQDPPDCC